MRLFMMIAVIAFVSAPLFAQKSESESAGKSGSSSAKAEVKVVGAKGVKVVKSSEACEGEDCEAEVEVKLPEAVQKVVDAIREKMDASDAIEIEAEVDGYKIKASKSTSEEGSVVESLDVSNAEADGEEIDIEDLPEDLRKIVEEAIEECRKSAEAEAKKTEGESKSEMPKKAKRKSNK